MTIEDICRGARAMAEFRAAQARLVRMADEPLPDLTKLQEGIMRLARSVGESES